MRENTVFINVYIVFRKSIFSIYKQLKMIYSNISYYLCVCRKHRKIVESNRNQCFNIIEANIRNFEPLSNMEREYIITSTTTDQKIELIFLYDMCVKTLITNMMISENNTAHMSSRSE